LLGQIVVRLFERKDIELQGDAGKIGRKPRQHDRQHRMAQRGRGADAEQPVLALGQTAHGVIQP
jgi:hypothetical protein